MEREFGVRDANARFTVTELELPDHVRRGIFEYVLPGDWQVLAGRTAADNEYLSIKFARANDWWFHVRGMPGSHVVLRATSAAEPDRATLERVAAIAAYHSKARAGGVVPVSATLAKNVRKAQIRKEIVLKVRPGLGDAVLQKP